MTSNQKPVVIVTGGAGFIGSALCRQLILKDLAIVINVDKLTYAASLSSLKEIEVSPNYHFRKVDICDEAGMNAVFAEFSPDGVFHLAAESHVDRSIHCADPFIETNLIGTYRLLECAHRHWLALPDERKSNFRLLHVSTDEVYGSLGKNGSFTEESAYHPSSPYSASKAGSDHLVTAWHQTYQLPTLISHCSNNYGPFQFPEKLIPLMILNCLHHKALPVYGDGEQMRDWIFVDDTAAALWAIWSSGKPGETYNVGDRNERKNIDLVRHICRLMDRLSPTPLKAGHESLITHVADRAGHDARYSINPHKLETQLEWRCSENFDKGIEKTVRWYLDHAAWWVM